MSKIYYAIEQIQKKKNEKVLKIFRGLDKKMSKMKDHNSYLKSKISKDGYLIDQEKIEKMK